MRETQDCDGNGLVIGFSSDAVYEAAINFGSMPFPVEIDFSTNMTCGGTTARH